MDAAETMNGRARFERRIRELEALGHRGSATDCEDRAADYLVKELQAAGIEACKEPFLGSSSLGARVLVHVVVALCGLVLLFFSPLLTLLIGVLVLVSFVGEMSTRFLLLGYLLPRQRSRNVAGRVVPAAGQPPRRRIILCAHIDTQRAGLIWRGGLTEPVARLLQRAPGPMKSPLFPVVFALALQPLVGLYVYFFSLDTLATVLVGVCVFVYAVSGFLLAEWSVGAFVPGACDNASGVAGAMELAERWSKEPVGETELVVLLTGCEETGALGAAAWLGSHQDELKETCNTFFVIDSLGYDAPRYLGGEHSLAASTFRYPPELVGLCEEVARRRGLEKAGPYTFPTFSDGMAFMIRGIQGVAVLTFKEDVTMPNYHQMSDTSANLDFDLGWDAVQYCWELLQELHGHLEQAAARQPGGVSPSVGQS